MECCIVGFVPIYGTRLTLAPRLAHAVTWPVPVPVAWGHHGPFYTIEIYIII